MSPPPRAASGISYWRRRWLAFSDRSCPRILGRSPKLAQPPQHAALLHGVASGRRNIHCTGCR